MTVCNPDGLPSRKQISITHKNTIMKVLKANTLILFFGALVALLNIQATEKVIETSFWVAANCEHCKDRIETAVDVKGVKFAEFDVETKQLKIAYKTDVININQIHQLLAAAGHDTKKVKATDAAYNKITKDCCKYRDPASCKKACGSSCKDKH